ncbi:aminopeptidase P family protein [Microvirga sp. BT689]|uniref:M24 family metallopeptidase n=1 Tax=Microvirga arvi TaxID=2778731 RepID=UPI0019504895|nr:Xaa-Pro peptidase family protein [Microvirga arvi]MBM6581193.1 aminopeptidase P family protein [Microvirga arvi]
MKKAASKEPALRALVQRLGLDAIVLMSPENFAYGSGLHIITVSMIRPRQAFLIMPRQGEPELVLCSIEVPQAKQEGWVSTIHPYTEFVHHPMDVLATRLKELGLASARVGMDSDYLPLSSYERFRELLPGIRVVNTTEEVSTVRVIKTQEEIDHIEHATRGTHQAVLDGMAQSKLGDSERDMCLKIASGIIRNGADGTAFLCFASGERTYMTHAMATDRVPKESEIIRFDLGGTYGVYSSDFARTYSTGNPTPLQRQTYSALVKVQKAVIDAVRPGLLAEDLYFLTRDEFQKNGLVFRQAHIGHSFGVELHETPMLRPGEKTKLAPGMILNIEPSVLDDNGTKYHTEDLLEVTESGFRLMTLGIAPEEIPIIGETVPVSA